MKHSRVNVIHLAIFKIKSNCTNLNYFNFRREMEMPVHEYVCVCVSGG